MSIENIKDKINKNYAKEISKIADNKLIEIFGCTKKQINYPNGFLAFFGIN